MQMLFELTTNIATNSLTFEAVRVLFTALLFMYFTLKNQRISRCNSCPCHCCHVDGDYKTLSVGQLDLQKLLRQTFRFNTNVLYTDSVFCPKKSLIYVIDALLKNVGVNEKV